MAKTTTAEDITRLREIADRLLELGVPLGTVKRIRAWILEEEEKSRRQAVNPKPARTRIDEKASKTSFE